MIMKMGDTSECITPKLTEDDDNNHETPGNLQGRLSAGEWEHDVVAGMCAFSARPPNSFTNYF